MDAEGTQGCVLCAEGGERGREDSICACVLCIGGLIEGKSLCLCVCVCVFFFFLLRKLGAESIEYFILPGFGELKIYE